MSQVFASSGDKTLSDDNHPAVIPRESSNEKAPLGHIHVAIVGTGFAGLGMAIRLKQQGFVPTRDLIIYFSGDEETDGNTAQDWVIVDGHHVQLRAERSGHGTGRIYTLTVICQDAAANGSSREGRVLVPR